MSTFTSRLHCSKALCFMCCFGSLVDAGLTRLIQLPKNVSVLGGRQETGLFSKLFIYFANRGYHFLLHLKFQNQGGNVILGRYCIASNIMILIIQTNLYKCIFMCNIFSSIRSCSMNIRYTTIMHNLCIGNRANLCIYVLLSKD